MEETPVISLIKDEELRFSGSNFYETYSSGKLKPIKTHKVLAHLRSNGSLEEYDDLILIHIRQPRSDEYHTEFSRLESSFLRSLPTYNARLLNLVASTFPKTNHFDFIILPSSKNEQLRKGLCDTFKAYYKTAEVLIAEKKDRLANTEKQFDLPRTSKHPEKTIPSILFLDDCIHKSTINGIRKAIHDWQRASPQLIQACYVHKKPVNS